MTRLLPGKIEADTSDDEIREFPEYSTASCSGASTACIGRIEKRIEN